MKLGFLGVGKWATKLATAFRECGAEIICHDRATPPAGDGYHVLRGFGARVPWRRMLEWADVDALILCAPPDVTTEAALACAQAGKRCVATKPLLLATGVPGDRLYVDLWRLYSPAWLALKEELDGKRIERIDVAFCGNGPFRSFPGVLDYGPHALAFVYDLLGTTELTVDRVEFDMADRLERRGAELWRLEATCSSVPIRMTIGNGAKEPERQVTVIADRQCYGFEEPELSGPEENPQRYQCGIGLPLEHGKSLALRRFCRAFMRGEASRTLEYSIAAMRVLERLAK